jgi:hypothetical protein
MGLPSNQVNKENSSKPFLCLDSQTLSNLSCITPTTPASVAPYSYLRMAEWKCGTTGCENQTTFSILLSNSKNPISAAATPTTFLFTFYSASNRSIYTCQPNIIALPELQIGAITNLVITPSSIFTLQPTTYTMTFIITLPVPENG